MRHRIFSLETEYGITHRSAMGAEVTSPDALIAALREAVSGKLGASGTSFLVNGSKLYADSGHAEWSLPECRSAREVVAYDRAADRTLAQAIPDAERMLSERGMPGRLSVIKNNVDTAGNSYGCHENYMASTETDWLDKMSHLRFSVRALFPFLATRQVLCGAGRLGWGTRGQDGVRFQISQRADFISELVSADTRHGRAIVNLGRENEPFAAGSVRRLHLILGDANLSGWATWMKLGTTGLVLRMIEDLALGEIPHLENPVAALRAVSRDPTCRVLLPLRDRTRRTAIEVQRAYCEAAADYLRAHEASEEEAAIVAAWGAALDALARDPTELAGKADWVTKWVLMTRHLERAGVSWDDLQGESPQRFAVQRIDIEYHDLSPDTGLFVRLLRRRADTLVTDREIESAARRAPPYTRAFIRGELVKACQHGLRVAVTRWDAVDVGETEIELGDPMQFFDGRVVRALAAEQGRRPASASRQRWMIEHVHRALVEAADPAVRIDAARALGAAPEYARFEVLRSIAIGDSQDGARAAAAEALAALRTEDARAALAEVAARATGTLRWRIDALLANAIAAGAVATGADRGADPAESAPRPRPAERRAQGRRVDPEAMAGATAPPAGSRLVEVL